MKVEKKEDEKVKMQHSSCGCGLALRYSDLFFKCFQVMSETHNDVPLFQNFKTTFTRHILKGYASCYFYYRSNLGEEERQEELCLKKASGLKRLKWVRYTSAAMANSNRMYLMIFI